MMANPIEQLTAENTAATADRAIRAIAGEFHTLVMILGAPMTIAGSITDRGAMWLSITGSRGVTITAEIPSQHVVPAVMMPPG